MHEFSLAQAIVRMVTESAQEESIQRVRRVTVVVGEWSAVLPEALSTSFAILAGEAGPVLAGASLEVIHRPAAGRCNGCTLQFAVGERGLSCPSCGGAATLSSGMEFYLDSYEGD